MKTEKGTLCIDKNIEAYALNNHSRLSALTTIEIIITAITEYTQQVKEAQSSPANKDLKQYITNLFYSARHDFLTNDEFDLWVKAEINNIDEFFKTQSPTDEEIEAYADKVCSVADEDEPEHTRIDVLLWDGFVQGAKALRDRKIPSKK